MSVTTSVTEISPERVRLDAEVPGDEVESRLQRAATALGREMRVPGFRQGKVPAAMVIQRVGREAVLEQALRDSLPEWYEEAILRSGVSTVGDPKLSVDDLPSAGQSLSFSIEVAVTPTAKLGKYEGLEVGRREPEIPADVIDHEIQHLREALAKLESVDRKAQEGDFLVMDFLGKVDGEPFEGGEARDFLLELGGGQLVEGFEEQLVGAGASESRSVEVDFPDDYRAEDLRGKHATFEIDVKDVKERELPELDDDFAAEASEFDTLDELRADVESKMRAAQERSIEDEFRGAAVDAAVEQASMSLSKELVEARAQEMWERTERALARQGIDPETYLKASGKTREQILEDAREDAERTLARESVLEAVAEAESIEVSDQELLDALEEAARTEGAEPSEVLERLRSSGRDLAIRRDLQLRRAVDVLAAAAKPIPLETAKAREQIWTPEKEADQGSGQLWTPGSDEPTATS
ncbi:MAG: trigger factor [Solirubrobacterales bacterium]